MTDYLAIPPARELAGEVRVPASKSATNRALVAAALGREPLEIVGPLESDDTAALRRCLAAMGAEIVERTGSLSVRGPLEGSAASPTTLDAADSGTAARFLAAAAAAVPGRFVLTGSPRLRERPMGELVDALRRAGACIEYAEIEGCLPVSIEGGSLTTGTVTVDASRSSQFYLGAPPRRRRRRRRPRRARLRRSGFGAVRRHDDRDSARPRARRVRGRRRDPRPSRARARGEIRSPRRLFVGRSADRGGRRRRRPDPTHGPAVAVGRRGRARPARARIDGSRPRRIGGRHRSVGSEAGRETGLRPRHGIPGRGARARRRRGARPKARAASTASAICG